MTLFAKPFIKGFESKTLKKGFKYRIYPTAEQRLYLARVFGSCRYVYNRLLSDTQQQYNAHLANKDLVAKPVINGIAMSYHLPLWKLESETNWLNEAPAQVLQHACKQLGDAYQSFFKKQSAYPRFKSKHHRQSITYSNQSYKLTEDGIKLAKCDSLIKVRQDRPLPSDQLGACTISMTSTGKYYASFLCEYVPEKTSGSGFVGIDAGITDLATLSNGLILLNPRHYLTSQHRLAVLQRRLARKQKGSKNRNKARLKVARLHELIANQRKDYLHKFTTATIRENQAVAIERLQVKNMVRNRHLAKHIADAGWGEMRRQFAYKAVASQHCLLVLADPYYPSTQLCHVCHTKPETKIKLGVTSWKCDSCGTVHARDHNAAMNLEILARSYHCQQQRSGEHASIILAKPYTPLV